MDRGAFHGQALAIANHTPVFWRPVLDDPRARNKAASRGLAVV